MYYPYFRGKQYELITIRENVELLRDSQFIPIIEPVKQALSGLEKALHSIEEASAAAIVIVNPFHGALAGDGDGLVELITNNFSGYANVMPGILLTEDTQLDEVDSLLKEFPKRQVVLVHAGFTNAKSLVDDLGDSIGDCTHIFYDDKCGKLYQKHFKSSTRILLRDGFKKRTNREHPDVEFFSDLHATYDDEGMDGFGDFLTVGDDYSESGGPAYAVAIHITFIDEKKDEEMHIHHFVSDRKDDPKDPAGKFAEALTKLAESVKEEGSPIFKGDAISEFLDLHKRHHFPGLGYVKKLSMKHHLETLADYFS